jgi:ComF family protein
MKQSRGHRLAVAAGRVVSTRLHESLASLDADLIVSIPSRWRRQLVQGINSPGVLARQMGRALRLPDYPQLLRWRRKVKRQHTLLPAERFRNVRGAMGLSRGYDIRGTRVLVVDDILTTGATANEAARVLRKAGASQIYVAVVARVADR